MSSALKMPLVMLIMLGASFHVGWACPDDPEIDLCDDESSDAMGLHLAGAKPLALTLMAALQASNVKNPALAVLLLPFADMLPKAMAAGPTKLTCGQMKTAYKDLECCGQPSAEVPVQIVPNPTSRITGSNPCNGQKALTQPGMNNKACFINAVANAGEQSGANVTAGYTGNMASTVTPTTDPYYMTTMCPVNVHWHLGAEHLSVGQYDGTGVTPGLSGYTPADDNPDASRRLAAARYGFACKLYDAKNEKFTTEYDWKYCKDMHVGETYEVHWPHSALGACGTPNQYQYPFYDGVFCMATEAMLPTLTPQQIASAVGVQGQVFTIINDESYFYPDMIRGMIVDADNNMGQDVAAYTGSTTGTTRNNIECSAYTPITWQVDRKCHLISASSFDKMCADMLQQRDDMCGDLHPHGARELVLSTLAADNHVNAAVGR